MPLLKKEDLELLDPKLRETLEAADRAYDATLSEKEKSDKIMKEVDDFFRTAYQNPAAVEKLKELIKITGSKIEIPDPPARKYVEPLENEIKELRKQLSEKEKGEHNKALIKRAEELGLSLEEVKTKAAEFQKKHLIQDDFSALELYAQSREPETPSVEYVKPFTFDKPPDETLATNNALKEIRALKSNMMGR